MEQQFCGPNTLGVTPCERSVFFFVVFLIGVISPSPMAQQALQDEGFEPTSTPLGPFNSTALDTWLVDCATLVTGPQSGVSPAAGTGMIQICPSGGFYSQVRQRIAVPPGSGDHAQVACVTEPFDRDVASLPRSRSARSMGGIALYSAA